MTVVDRSVDPVLQIPYTIPYEDTQITPDEVATSRRHQFFAFCQGHDPQTLLPAWITDVDVREAESKALVDATSITSEDVLETSATYENCWVRLNGDDERRPITCEQASSGVAWDTTNVPAGTYVINGYTWEPPFNLWTLRYGVIKVVDSPDPTASGPALAISNGETIVWEDGTALLTGCVDAMDGSAFSAYWALADGDTASWNPIVVDEPMETTTFELAFDPPSEAIGILMVKVEIVDPNDRSYTAYMNDVLTQLRGNDPEACDESSEASGGGFIGNPGCEESGDDGDETGTTSSAYDFCVDGPMDGSTDGSTSADTSTTGLSGSSTTSSSEDVGESGTPIADGPRGCSFERIRYDSWASLPWLIAFVFRRRRFVAMTTT